MKPAADDAQVGARWARSARGSARAAPAARTSAARHRGSSRGAQVVAGLDGQGISCGGRARAGAGRARRGGGRRAAGRSAARRASGPPARTSAGCAVTVIRLHERNHSM